MSSELGELSHQSHLPTGNTLPVETRTDCEESAAPTLLPPIQTHYCPVD